MWALRNKPTPLVGLILLLLLPAFLYPQGDKLDPFDPDFVDARTVQLEPPASIRAETSRLAFHVSPLSARGLLTQQVKDAVDRLRKDARRGQIVKIRAFVAGTGDIRRVPAIIAEMFDDKNQPLPVMNVVQVGMLPLEGAQVSLEAISVARNEQNPRGLAFVAGQEITEPIDVERPRVPLTDLVGRSLEGVRAALRDAGVQPADALRVSCFLSSLDDVVEVRRQLASEFRGAAINLVQLLRSPARHAALCEAVARLKEKSLSSVADSNGSTSSVFVSAPQVLFTSMQLGFRFQDADIRLAFARLASLLEAGGAGMDGVVYSNVYAVSGDMRERVKAMEPEFFKGDARLAASRLVLEGLPALDTSFGIDVIALPR